MPYNMGGTLADVMSSVCALGEPNDVNHALSLECHQLVHAMKSEKQLTFSLLEICSPTSFALMCIVLR